jgi:hypothetical protein
MKNTTSLTLAALTMVAFGSSALAAPLMCTDAGPQTPRDISSVAGSNNPDMSFAPASTELNLCNIHTHTNAEHKGPGFSVSTGSGTHAGYQCNETADLTEAELEAPHGDGHDDHHGVVPGDTIEVHWVHTSCATEGSQPGPTLGPCIACDNPVVRVETQVFLVVNDNDALNFNDFAYEGNMVGDLHQPKALPTGTGDPIQFWGSTTGTSYDNDQLCSPFVVTWSIRPQCAKVDAASVNKWLASDNAFEEDHSHGIRQLVVDPAMLSQIGG